MTLVLYFTAQYLNPISVFGESSILRSREHCFKVYQQPSLQLGPGHMTLDPPSDNIPSVLNRKKAAPWRAVAMPVFQK